MIKANRKREKVLKEQVVRPTSFKFQTFDWVIMYTDQESAYHGTTERDTKEIMINLRVAVSEQLIKDALLHELLHVVNEDVFKALGDMDEVKWYDKEEHQIRFVTPRLNMLLKNNPGIVTYLWG